MVLLPRPMREKHGAAMSELYERALARSEANGRGAVWWAAVGGLADLAARSVYERVREERAALGGPNLQVLRQLARAYVTALAALTTVLLSQYAWRQLAGGRRRELPIATALEAIVFSIPFTAALAIPMAVFIAVLYAGTRASADGAPHAHGGRLRLAPLVGLASVVALFGFAWNAEVVPRANARLSSLYSSEIMVVRSDRSLTLTELRAKDRRIAQQRDATTNVTLREAAVSTGVEIHQKLALAAACVVLALLAAGIARRAPRAGLAVQALASVVVFSGYYISLMTGESLADRFLVSPAIAMWSANIMALALTVLALRPRSQSPLAESRVLLN
ncbi:LptF/LptG family permease [Gemmatimonas sp.]|uniref:LptF/LptG family permease n=1 Tax=Gemmatimonas sp. TaxID=1962908 RepID=UPI0039839571